MYCRDITTKCENLHFVVFLGKAEDTMGVFVGLAGQLGAALGRLSLCVFVGLAGQLGAALRRLSLQHGDCESAAGHRVTGRQQAE